MLVSKNNASGGGGIQTGTSFSNENKVATGFFLVDHLESKSDVLLHTPLRCENPERPLTTTNSLL
jgi:hypothetical protein